MSEELVKRLREWNRQYSGKMPDDIVAAADLIESLRQQLAAALAAIKVKDEALNKTWLKVIKGFSTTEWEFIVKALAAHPNIDIDIDRMNGGN